MVSEYFPKIMQAVRAKYICWKKFPDCYLLLFQKSIFFSKHTLERVITIKNVTVNYNHVKISRIMHFPVNVQMFYQYVYVVITWVNVIYVHICWLSYITMAAVLEKSKFFFFWHADSEK